MNLFLDGKYHTDHDVGNLTLPPFLGSCLNADSGLSNMYERIPADAFCFSFCFAALGDDFFGLRQENSAEERKLCPSIPTQPVLNERGTLSSGVLKEQVYALVAYKISIQYFCSAVNNLIY